MAFRGLLSSDLQIQKSSTIEVKEYVNPLYTLMLLYQMSKETNKVKTMAYDSDDFENTEFARYLAEFTKSSEIPNEKIYGRDSNKFDFIYNSEDILKIESSENPINKKKLYLYNDNGNIVWNAYHAIMNILFIKYKKYNIQSLFNDQKRLLVFLNVKNNDVSNFKDYLSQQDITKPTKDSISFSSSKTIFDDMNLFYLDKKSKDDKNKSKSPTETETSTNKSNEKEDSLLESNIFYLNVLTKSDMTKENYENHVESEFRRLTEYIQARFVDGTKSVKSSNYLPAFKEVIFFIDEDKENSLSAKYFKTNVSSEKYKKILNEKYKEFKKNTEGNLQQGIQTKKIIKQIVKNPFFDLSFKDLNKELNILSNIKSQNKPDKSIDKGIINKIFAELYFSHFTLNELYKEFFDKSYLASKISVKTTEKKSSFTIYYKYTIQKDEDLYDIPKVVANNNFIYDLEITGFDEYIFSGYFKTRGRYNVFKLTEIFFLGNNFFMKLFIDFFYQIFKESNGSNKSLGKFLDKIKESASFSNEMNDILRGVYKSINAMSNEEKDFSNILSSKTGSDSAYKIKDFLVHLQKNTEDARESNKQSQDEKLLKQGKIVNFLLRTVRERINNVENIAFMILNYEKITLQITKTKSLHKFTVLNREKNNRGSESNRKQPYVPKFYGILKRHVNYHYFESFTMNRLDPKLPENSQIFFYDDLLITKDILIEFLKSRDQYNKDVNLPSSLLGILNNFAILDELFIYINDNYRKNIYIGNRNDIEYYNFREKCISNILEILFERGTKFYVSKMLASSASSGTGSMNTTYTIDEVDNEHILVEKVKPEDVKSLADPIKFYGEFSKTKDELFNSFNKNSIDIDNSESTISDSSILYTQSKKKVKDKYITFNDFSDKVINESSYDDKSIVILEIFLLPSSSAKTVNTCNARKARVNRSVNLFLGKQIRNFNIWTRKILNEYKNRRLTQKLRTKGKSKKITS